MIIHYTLNTRLALRLDVKYPALARALHTQLDETNNIGSLLWLGDEYVWILCFDGRCEVGVQIRPVTLLRLESVGQQ